VVRTGNADVAVQARLSDIPALLFPQPAERTVDCGRWIRDSEIDQAPDQAAKRDRENRVEQGPFRLLVADRDSDNGVEDGYSQNEAGITQKNDCIAVPLRYGVTSSSTVTSTTVNCAEPPRRGAAGGFSRHLTSGIKDHYPTNNDKTQQMPHGCGGRLESDHSPAAPSRQERNTAISAVHRRDFRMQTFLLRLVPPPKPPVPQWSEQFRAPYSAAVPGEHPPQVRRSL